MDKDKLFYDVVSKFQPEDVITTRKYDDGKIGMSLCILKDTFDKIEDSLWELLDSYSSEELYDIIRTTLVSDEQNTKLNEKYHGPMKIGEIDHEICKPADPSSPLTEESFQRYVDQLGGKHPIKPYSPIVPIHLYSMIKSEG